MHDMLVREFEFPETYQVVRRYLKRAYGAVPVQAVRRIETAPQIQAQHNWFEWPGLVAGTVCTLYRLIGTSSLSRAMFIWASHTISNSRGRLGTSRYSGATAASRYGHDSTISRPP